MSFLNSMDNGMHFVVDVLECFVVMRSFVC